MGREEKKKKEKEKMLLACEVMGCEQRACLVGERERERVKVDIILHCVQLIYCSSFFFWKGG